MKRTTFQPPNLLLESLRHETVEKGLVNDPLLVAVQFVSQDRPQGDGKDGDTQVGMCIYDIRHGDYRIIDEYSYGHDEGGGRLTFQCRLLKTVRKSDLKGTTCVAGIFPLGHDKWDVQIYCVLSFDDGTVDARPFPPTTLGSYDGLSNLIYQTL